ncbi:hypothetical protein FSP39_014526 [Pinctada imbricata]|uniref:Uncharacterized protein n=1 Tax=Pinctada imbricata TaxID=66713 RepID=A0AA89BQY5_PINIB|nr:hypothetical protein FSP39_014526 [Pinctada imbricata]
MVTGAVGIHGAEWGSGDVWPSDEMKSRGMLRGLWVGVLIALPSGAGVALSVLGGNAGSLVGVAISASLLPPAVNAVTTEFVYKGTLNCAAFENNDYEPIHSCNMSVETAILGVISLALTLLNISCIIIMGIIVLKIKEVAPQASVDENTTFWHEDIKIVRDSYATTKGKDSATMATQARQIIQEWRVRFTTNFIYDERDFK